MENLYIEALYRIFNYMFCILEHPKIQHAIYLTFTNGRILKLTHIDILFRIHFNIIVFLVSRSFKIVSLLQI
jgi:hypothetical protein